MKKIILTISVFLTVTSFVHAVDKCKLPYNKFLMERHCLNTAGAKRMLNNELRKKYEIASKLIKNNQFKWGILEDGNNCNLKIYTQGVLDGNSYSIEVQCQLSNAYRRCVKNWFNDEKADHMVCARIMFKDAGDSRKTVNRGFFIR